MLAKETPASAAESPGALGGGEVPSAAAGAARTNITTSTASRTRAVVPVSDLKYSLLSTESEGNQEESFALSASAWTR